MTSTLLTKIGELTTHDPAELMGSNAARFVHPEDRASVAEGFRSLLASVGEGVQTWEFRCPQGDGGTRIISATAANRLKDPTIGGIVVNARDVTATRVVEVQFRQAH